MARRRETNIFSLSLLDCICCGFGALILFHMIIASRSGQRYEKVTETLQAFLRQVLGRPLRSADFLSRL